MAHKLPVSLPARVTFVPFVTSVSYYNITEPGPQFEIDRKLIFAKIQRYY